MHLGGRAAVIVSAAALTGGLAGLAGLSGPAIAGAAASPAVAQATVLIHPDVQYAGHNSKQPPTTADCEAAYKVACYEAP